MKPVIPLGYSATQAEITAGAFDAKVGGVIHVVDGNGQPTGVQYDVGAAGNAPTQMVTGGNINTVLQAAGGAGWVKAQATATNYAITRPTSGASLDLHIETGGTLAAMLVANWPIPAAGVDQLRIRNFSAAAQTFSATGYSGIVTADGNVATSGTYSIPVDMAVHITIDEDGWIQVAPMGQEVSQAEFDAALALKANLASPALTGTPTVPTAAVGANTTQIASTAFVQAEIAADLATVAPLMDGTAAVGTSTNMARQDHVHPTDTSRAPLASPTFTGTPAAPTAAIGTNSTQIATTAFVLDATTSSAAGMDWKDSVKVTTTANITLSGTQTIDGVSVVTGDRVLVKNQTTGSGNGIYVVAAGAWARAADMNVNNEASAGVTTYVEGGTVHGQQIWMLVTAGATLGTTALTFARLGDPSSILAQTVTLGVTTTAPSQDAVATALASKQATLVSGTNIKTIDGQSLVGSGNLAPTILLVTAPIAIRITGAAGAGTNYQTKLTIGESGGATGANFNLLTAAATFPAAKNGTCSFLFWDSTGAVPFWVEKVTGTTPNRVAHVWVLPNIDLSSGTQTVFLTTAATNIVRSNGDGVFTLFDDFDGASVDATKWDTSVLSGQTIASSVLSFGGGNVARKLQTLNTVGDGFEIMSMLRASDTAASYVAFGWDSLTTANIYKYQNGWDAAAKINVAGALTTLTNDINNGAGTRQLMRIARAVGVGRFTSENPANAANSASGVPTVAIAPTIFATYDNSTEVDWVAIKKFVATEPAFASAVQ